MSAYLLVRVSVTDKQRYLEYAEAARGIAPKYGAQFISAGRPVSVLEDGAGAGEPVFLTRWPDEDAIRAFWNSPEYQAAITLRKGAADVTAAILKTEIPGELL